MKRLTSLGLLLIAVVIGGCSNGKIATENVTGTVLLDGTPLAGASVNFHPKTQGQGTPGYAVTNEKGEYILQTLLGNAQAGTVAGDYTVTVSKKVTEDTKIAEYGSKEYNTSRGSSQPKETLPAIYIDPKTTPFSATVQKGNNTYDFEVKMKQ